ncbi:MAG: histidine ammonia-lyase [Candidatus Eremiobacter antarcticus]|nr:histidine ammonia-lyase [Candidatus Eremiobacteraeota bacterium]MBC5808670.1 histidine ammonia-lyase [Candidatus Eremiobacteraeota bacterium]PZR62157.1 MAG: histidine ammonia-lyase [Candidatus Eremiobacter sp. RRmetagenome_bin22]
MQTVSAVGIDGTNLSLATVQSVACERLRVELTDKARAAMRASRDVVEQAVAADGQVYGVTTGFGRLKNVRIAPAEAAQLQRNLILSHCAGVGEPLSHAAARAAMLLRAHSLARGYSGVRIELVQLLIDMLNAGLAAVIPSKGSVGCSGDLAPLAHMALTLLGEGEVLSGGARMPASQALQSAGLRPMRLSYKEGISLINGTQIMTAIGGLALLAARSALKALDIAGAMSLEAFLGSDAPFAERINALRPYRGQARSASNLRHLLAGSEVMASHRDCDRVQDPYSFRCMPVVHGAARDTLNYAESVLEIEINAVTDNPIVFADDGALVSNGNFHGGPVGLALDYAAIALTDASSICERRCYKLLEGLEALPPFLSERFGMCSGYMLAQYTAAALVSENKTLAVPASTDSIPTSAGQEDHNSMGTISARQCAAVVENFQTVVAIELLEAAQALDFRAPLRYGRGTAIAHRVVRERVPHLDDDRNLSTDIEAAVELVRSGALVTAVEDEMGSL